MVRSDKVSLDLPRFLHDLARDFIRQEQESTIPHLPVTTPTIPHHTTVIVLLSLFQYITKGLSLGARWSDSQLIQLWNEASGHYQS